MTYRLAFIVLLAPVIAIRGDDTPADDLTNLQGTWQVTKAVYSGKEAPKAVADDAKLIIAKDVLTFVSSNEKNTAKLTLDADVSKSPRRFDAEVLDGNSKGKTRKAIYELSGDVLKLCWSFGDAYPEKLASDEQSTLLYLELKRVKK